MIDLEDKSYNIGFKVGVQFTLILVFIVLGVVCAVALIVSAL